MRNVISSAVLGWTLLTGMGVIAAVVAPPAIAQETYMNVLTVTGQGTERIEATRAHIMLGVDIQRETAEAAQQEVARRSTAVVEVLRDRGVENLQTAGIRLEPQYRYDNGQSELAGYIATNIVSFEMLSDNVGSLLDDAVAVGATRLSCIRFSGSEDAIATAREAALRKAVANAQSQANAVLETLGLNAEEIVGIQIDGANTPIVVSRVRQAELAVAEVDVSTPVIGGEQTVTASVTLQIRY